MRLLYIYMHIYFFFVNFPKSSIREVLKNRWTKFNYFPAFSSTPRSSRRFVSYSSVSFPSQRIRLGARNSFLRLRSNIPAHRPEPRLVFSIYFPRVRNLVDSYIELGLSIEHGIHHLFKFRQFTVILFLII